MGIFGIHSSYHLKKGEQPEVRCTSCKWEGLVKHLREDYDGFTVCPVCDRSTIVDMNGKDVE